MHEAARPEAYQTPESSIFNVEAMSDEQIILLHRGLTSAFDSEEVASGIRDKDIAEGMVSQLRSDFGNLASRDPERVKRLVEWCMHSDKGYDHEFAETIAPSLVAHDYPFVRDTLISLSIDGLEMASEGTFLTIPRLMRDHLTPEQVADFNAHLEVRGADPMSPARPDQD